MRGTATFRGFTLVELMVASSIVSIALLGVYSVMRQCVEVEGRMSLEWDQRATAQGAVDAIADTIRRCVNTPGHTAITAGVNQTTSVCTVTCTAFTTGPGDPAAATGPVMERRRFRWETRPKEGQDIRVSMQRLPLSGAVIIAAVKRGEDESESDFWRDVERLTIARNLTHLSVRFRAADDPEARWKAGYKGRGENVIVWVQGKAGDAMAERYVSVTAVDPVGGGD